MKQSDQIHFKVLVLPVTATGQSAATTHGFTWICWTRTPRQRVQHLIGLLDQRLDPVV